MQTFTQTFAGAQDWVLNVPGNYFILLGATNNVNIAFFKGGKRLDLGTIQAVLPGIEAGPFPDPGDALAFDRVIITLSGADTITVGIGNGLVRYNRSQGSVSVTGFASSLTDAFSVSLVNTDLYLTTEDMGIPAGVSTFQSNTAMVANTPENVFSAAANVNGAILWKALHDTRALGTVNASWLSKATAPATVIDGAVWGIQRGGVTIGSDEAAYVLVERPQRIASGLRLDAIATLASTKSLKHALYSLL